MRRCFVCNSFITLSKTCCVCQKYKGCKLELCPLFLGWDIHVSCACTHEQMACTSKFSTVNIGIMRAYVCMCVTVTRPPDKAVIFSLIDEFSHIRLLRGDNHLIAGHVLFPPPSLNSWSRRLWHCPDISGIPSSPDKSCLTIIFTDFMQGD